MAGLEPAASCSQSRRANQLCHIPLKVGKDLDSRYFPVVSFFAFFAPMCDLSSYTCRPWLVSTRRLIL